MRLRFVIRLGALLLAILFIYLGVTFVQVWRASRRDQARMVDAIVVLGAAQYNGQPSPVLRARLDHAVELREAGVSRIIVVTGGKAPGDQFTEAAASARYLRSKGVPDDDILEEVDGRNTWESLAASELFLSNRGINSVLLVTDGFHAYRARAMANELGLEAYVSPADGSPIGGVEEWVHLGKETFIVSVGRVVGFSRLMRIDRRVDSTRDGTG